MKHKHYDMIVAKAENMDLVVSIKLGDKWEVISGHENQIVNFGSHYDYFLCLPQHKEACLYWLNGGGVQDNFEGEWSDCPSLSQTKNTDSENSLVFSVHHMFMNEEFQFRIKPKKEKRWVLECNGTFVTTRIFTSEGAAKLWIEEFDRADEGIAVIEIEIEVKD